jgi:hypothetical protein
MIGIDEEKFWREMSRMPDLQTLIERAGRRLAARLGEEYDPKRHAGYPEITLDEWGKWDSSNTEFRALRRQLATSLAAIASTTERQTPECDPKAGELKQIKDELRFITGTPLRSDDDRLRRQALWQRLDQLMMKEQTK